jgi:hypothetical protein
MRKNKIIVHCLVKNEENYIWYALQSVLPYVDKIMVWDTGSEDKTIEIIRSINSSKLDFVERGSVDLNSFTKVRNEMLEATDKKKYDWLMILDGDEIWPSDSLKKVIAYLKSHEDSEAVFVRTLNSVGDIYHALPESAGQYIFKDKKGHLALRFFNLKTITGLHVDLPHGQEGYYAKDNCPIQSLPKVNFVDTFYIHTTHLQRSSKDNFTLKRGFKRKYEIGRRIDKKDLPKIFFEERPENVPCVNNKMNTLTLLRCLIETPPKLIKRLIYKSNKSGY